MVMKNGSDGFSLKYWWVVSVVGTVVISCFKTLLYTDGTILFLAKIYKFIFVMECIPVDFFEAKIGALIDYETK